MNAEILYFHSNTINENLTESENIVSLLANQLGIENIYHKQVNADEKYLTAALKSALGCSQIVFYLGDIKTISKTVSNLLHLKTTVSQEYSDFLKRNDIYDEECTFFPEGSDVFFDRESYRVAFIQKTSGKVIFALPSCPDALYNIIDECIIPFFSKEYKRCLSRAHISLFGADADDIQKRLDSIKRTYNVNINVANNGGIFNLTISACSKSFMESDSVCSGAISDINSSFSYDIFDIGRKSLATTTVEALKKNSFTVASAESCTGGMLSQRITSISGASSVMEMGICAYSNRIKRDALGVKEDILSTYGAISKETAAALATGIRNLSGATFGIGITGVAGPGTSEGKPVGTVYVALFDGKNYWIRSLNMSEDSSRYEIREYAVNTALDLIRRYIISIPGSLSGSCTIDTLFPLNKQPRPDISLQEDNTLLTIKEEASSPEEEIFYTFSDEEKSEPEPQVDFYDFAGSYHINTDINDDIETEIIDDTDTSMQLVTSNEPEDNKKEKNKKIKNIFGLLIKGTNAQKIIKISFAVVAVLIVVLCIIGGIYFGNIYRDRSQINNARAAFSKSTSDTLIALSNQNNDLKGWISIEGTEVNNPVYQADNNTFYTKHNMKKQKSRYGALFFDYRNTISGNESGENLVIYGQNMDDGSMFGSLSNYQSLPYLTKNKDITLTLDNSARTYRIFAVMVMNATTKDDNGYLFEFTKTSFTYSNTFESWINELAERNLYISDMKVEYGDNLLTLVTTDNSFKNARLVVVAKEIQDINESYNIDINPSPRYPQVWYDSRNIEAVWKNSSQENNSSITSSQDNGESSEETSSSESSSQHQESSSQVSSVTSTPTESETEPENESEPETIPENNNSPDNNENENNNPPEDDENNENNENEENDEQNQPIN